LLANVDRTTERVILDHLDKNAPELAAEVRKLTFTFENLNMLDDPSLQRVLREVDAKDLAMALRGVEEGLRDKIFKNLSSRAADMLREDISASGPVRVRQVEEAQQRIVSVVRRLEESGDLVIQRGNDDALV
jgi:flagellar motor switch protein FliG